MFCCVLASALRTLALCLFRLCFCLLVPQSQPGTGVFPSLLPQSMHPCWPFYRSRFTAEKGTSYELEGVKRVRSWKYLIEQQPYCAPSSSDSSSSAGHKLRNPEDVTGICSPSLMCCQHGVGSSGWHRSLTCQLWLSSCAAHHGVPGCQREGCSAHKDDVCVHSGN